MTKDSVAAVSVTYRTTLDGELRAFMTVQLIKYLLFMRGQIPCLYDELLQVVQQYQQKVDQGSRRRLPTSGSFKKALKCVEATELLFKEQIYAVFTLKVQRVALVFGASMMSPREVVVVDFREAEPLVEEDGAEEAPTLSLTRSREKLMQLCTQKLLRAIFTRAMEPFARPLSATKLHVAVLAERQSICLAGFIPKQHFSLRLPKKTRTHCIVIRGSMDCATMNDRIQDIDNELDRETQSILMNDSKDLWYVLAKPVPGFSDVIQTLDNQ